MNKKQKIKKIALQVRQWCEKVNNDYNLFDDDFAGMCGIASVYLYKQLKKHGMRPKIVENNAHCFIVCEGYIVDVTATQFGYRRVFVEEFNQAEHDGSWWSIERTFTNLKKFAKHQNKSWPTDQCYKTVEYLTK